ncbi:MAG: hypothetical protein KTR31_06625 [Myxococcales bacterium]|nr:hypothetical protein [Myxococcales bacterium]
MLGTERCPSAEEELARRAQQGDAQAIEAIYCDFVDLVVLALSARMGERSLPQQPEDLADVAFLTAVRTFDGSRTTAAHPFLAWWLLLAKRLALDQERVEANRARLARANGELLQAQVPTPPDRRAELQQVLRVARGLIREHCTVLDGPLFDRWLARGGDRRWKDLAAEMPAISVDHVLDVGSAPCASALEDVQRVLNAFHRARLQLVVFAPNTQAVRRWARLVLEQIHHGLRPRTVEGQPRITLRHVAESGLRRAEFHVVAGGDWTADQARIRVQSILDLLWARVAIERPS